MILAIETSTKSCSVALVSLSGKLLAKAEEQSNQFVHSEKLHVFIKQVLTAAAVKSKDLNAVAVCKGPGSYTGLRIGVSAAKGLCYPFNTPLISDDVLNILVKDFIQQYELKEHDLIIPMIDARRMEVYCSVHNHLGLRKSTIEAKVIAEDSFKDLSAKRIHLIGDGAPKLKEILAADPKVKIYQNFHPKAEALAQIAIEKLAQKQTESLAYFEPFYLKDFKAIKPKNPFA